MPAVALAQVGQAEKISRSASPAFHGLAIVALPVVDADNAAAVRAPVLFPLIIKESLHPVLFNLYEIFNHAHVVSLAVAFINVTQVAAGEVFTFIAEGNPIFGKVLAASFYKGAQFITRAAAGAVYTLLFGEIPGKGQVGAADAAVHAAGSNQLRGEL